MATLPETMAGREFLVYLGNGASPNVASLVCGLQTNQFNRSKELNQTAVVPCDPPGGQPVNVSTPGAKSATLEGSGVYAMEKQAVLDAAFDDADSQTWAFVIKNKGYYWGKFHFATYNLDGSDVAGLGQISVSLQNDAEWAWEDDITAGTTTTFNLPAAP